MEYKNIFIIGNEINQLSYLSENWIKSLVKVF
jgi:hypothetical protein